MDNSKAKLICLLFKLKPALKNSVDKHKYQKTINSFEEHYVDFFKREGVLELTRAYGDMDERIAELLPEHIALRRENAMCKGDDWCDFLYYRK